MLREVPCMTSCNPLPSSSVRHDATPCPRIPDHVRFIELLALQLYAQYGMSRDGVEYLLKSFSWALGPGHILKPRREEDEEGPMNAPLLQSFEALVERWGQAD
ncbi:hypothetical protein FRC12_019600 [Ceratobasidium sp. 428]|nr:hypothetical protein FRC12_019600 [Ceratobasidium sp. 428]